MTPNHLNVKELFIVVVLLVCSPIVTASEWFQSQSESEIAQLENGLYWSPVKKPTTVHRYFTPVRFAVGDTITLRGIWRSDGDDDRNSNRDFECATADPTDQGEGISDRYLRCLAGTGDFRLGLFDSAQQWVGNGSCDGNDRKTNCKDGNQPETRFNDYKGFQVRVHPHLSYGFQDITGRLREKKSDGYESHINLNLWTRIKPGENGLMSDECQAVDHCGFSKSDGYGTQPQSWGPEMPFGEGRQFSITATRVSTEAFVATVRMNGVEGPELSGRFTDAMQPDVIDTFAITYTNSSRRYHYVELTNVELIGEAVTDENNGSLIVNVQTESQARYRVQSSLSAGVPVYVDRAYLYTETGDFAGAEFIQTANEDDYASGDEFLRITLNQAAEVSVFYDARATSLPRWLESWELGSNRVATNDTQFVVLTKRFAAGNISFGGNDRATTGAKSMYTVAARPIEVDVNDIPIVGIEELATGQLLPVITPVLSGQSVYSDRDYIFTNSSELGQVALIQTRNDAKSDAGSASLKFTLTEPAIVYVLFDSRADSLPDWLIYWEPTGHFVATSDTQFAVYQRFYTAGDVILGGNNRSETGASSMYSVMVQLAN